MASLTGMELVKSHSYTIEDLIKLRTELPADREGFVIRFESGLRVKFKGEEYMALARILSRLSPLALWENMENGKVRVDFLVSIPEEFQEDVKVLVKGLEGNYLKTLEEIESDFQQLPTHEQTKEAKKQLGLFIQTCDLKHKRVMFSYLYSKTNPDHFRKVDEYVMKQIRPHANILVS